MGMTLSELWRRVQNIVTTASVHETKSADGKMLVKVKYSDDEDAHISDWLPVSMVSNSLVKIWLPPQKGEQVTILRPFGEGDGGIVIPSLYNIGQKEPVGAKSTNAMVTFNDGTTVTYDVATKTLTAMSKGPIVLGAPSVIISGNLNVYGMITDMRGDLTNHTHTVDGKDKNDDEVTCTCSSRCGDVCHSCCGATSCGGETCCSHAGCTGVETCCGGNNSCCAGANCCTESDEVAA